MSELIAFITREGFEAYIKSEADKVIAEKDKEIAEQKRLRDMALASVPNVLKVMKIIQHHKRKRCLAMANWCEEVDLFGGYTSNYWMRWRNKWRELAEKFKPNNSTAQ